MIKEDKPKENWAKDLNSHFTEEIIPKANKHTKRYFHQVSYQENTN